MEFHEVVRRRRMVRNFDARPLGPEIVERVVAAALRAPSAGNTHGVELLVLDGPAQTARYWDACFPPERRDGFRWPGLFRAPLLVVPLACEQAYADRYAEADKARLGHRRAPWPARYWDVDAAFSSMLVLLAAVDAGLGALFFGVFEPDRLRAEFGIPERYSPVGAIAIGHPLPDEPSPSLSRPRRPPGDLVHRGAW